MNNWSWLTEQWFALTASKQWVLLAAASAAVIAALLRHLQSLDADRPWAGMNPHMPPQLYFFGIFW